MSGGARVIADGGNDAVREAFAAQARWCDRLGSPFTARLMRSLGSVLDRGTRTGRAVLDWRGDAVADAVPLRLAGGFSALARDGRHPELAAVWPPDPVGDDEVLRTVVVRTLHEDDDALVDWTDRPPQTNEVGRSAAVYAALMHVASRTSLPVALFELGASAGLNLLCDRHAYRLGGRECGTRGAAVVLAPDWNGPAPDGMDPVIVSRRGCDRSPVDVTDSVARERLLAYVWPDQSARLERLVGALVAARIRACALAATVDAPFAHVAFEQDGERGPALDVTLWNGDDGSGTTVRLARGQAHGASFEWYGAGEP